MNFLIQWLGTPVPRGELVVFCIAAVALYLAFGAVMAFVLRSWINEEASQRTKSDDMDNNLARPRRWGYVLPAIVLFEEAVYRWVPLGIAVALFGMGIVSVGIAVVSSILFGRAHGGWRHVPFQGIGGLIFCCVYFRCGGVAQSYATAWAATYCTHLAIVLLLVGFLHLCRAIRGEPA